MRLGHRLTGQAPEQRRDPRRPDSEAESNGRKVARLRQRIDEPHTTEVAAIGILRPPNAAAA